MAWIGSAPNQVTQRTDGTRTGAAVCAQAKVALVNDTAVLADAREQDLANMINDCLKKDGGNQPSANLPMNTHRHTGVGAATARTHYARADQAQDSALIWGGVAGGTANAITLDLTPSITAYAAGQMFIFQASADNTAATDINVDAVGSVNLFKLDGATELAAGDIQEDGLYLVLCNGTDFVLVGAIARPAATEALAALTPAADRLPYFTGADAAALATFTAFGRTLAALADAAAGRTALEIATATESAEGLVEQATSAEIRAATAGAKAIMAEDLETASAAVALTETAGSIAVDWDAFVYGEVTIDENTTIANPTNGQPGTWRTLYVVGNNTTDRTISFGNQFLGEVPVITDCDSGRAYLISIFCRTASHFVASSKRALG
jgi:hypothetical protein